MEFLKLIFEWFKERVARPLSRAVAQVTVILGTIAWSVNVFEGYSWRDVFLSSYFLTALALALLWILITLWRHRSRITKPQLRLGYPIVLIAVLLTSYAAWKAWSYAYNPIGLFEARWWQPKSNDTDRKAWHWDVIAAGEKPIGIIFRVTACNDVNILSLYPTAHGLVPTATEVGFQSNRYREWDIKGFQQPSELQVWIFLDAPVADANKCLRHEIRTGG